MLQQSLHIANIQRTGYYKRLRRRRFLSLTAICLALSLLALFVAAGLLAREVQETRDSITQRRMFALRADDLQTVRGLLQQAETAQRGVLLTGRTRYLTPYSIAAADLPPLLERIAKASANDELIAARVADIQQLAELKLAELAETINLYKAGDMAAALKLVQTDSGQHYMETLRQQIDLALESLHARSSAADSAVVGEMIGIKRLAWGTAAALTITILLAAFQLRSLVRLRSHYENQASSQASILNAIVDEIPDAVAIFDRQLRYKLVNKAFERLRNRSRETVIGKTYAEVMGEAEFEKSRPLIARCLDGEHVSMEKTYPDSFNVRHVTASYAPLVSDEGTVEGIVAMAHDITGHREERDRLQHLSERDSLTGLLNRAAIEAWLMDASKELHGRDLAVLYIDLDHFKPVNDKLGHAVGDEVLKKFAKRMRAAVRPTDAVARLGGDEFVIALRGVRSTSDVEHIAEKIVAEARRPMRIGDHAVNIGASVGLAVDASQQPDGWQGLLARADEMLYRAKRSGRGRFNMHLVKG